MSRSAVSIWILLSVVLFYSQAFPNERIPSLEDAVKVCLDLDLKMFFDVKGNSKLVRVGAMLLNFM